MTSSLLAQLLTVLNLHETTHGQSLASLKAAVKLIPVTSDNDIINAVVVVTRVPEAELKSRSRDRHITDARFLAMGLLRSQGYGYKPLGRMFNRDHATAIHAVKQFDTLTDTNPEFRAMRERVEKIILSENQ